MVSEACKRHKDRKYDRWCLSCENPLCVKCNEHQEHETHDIDPCCVVCREESNISIIHLRGNIQQKEIGKRQVRNDFLLEIMLEIDMFHESIIVTDMLEIDEDDNWIRHISLGLPNTIWISDKNSLILIDTTGDTLDQLAVTDIGTGVHTVTNEKELIYINENENICKLSKDNTTESTIILKSDPWRPLCVYSSTLNGDLLVGSGKYEKDNQTESKINQHFPTEARVNRYDSKMLKIQTIQYKRRKKKMYKCPAYITENSNGDVIVSDKRSSHSDDNGVVVVTDRQGIFRFSYNGPPFESQSFFPCGICTDGLSNIVVCDHNSGTVQLINKDGHFLMYLLTSPDIMPPWSLAYDEINHRLLVESSICEIFLYRYINRKDYY
ncbi:uncharacterized protein LOC134258863 [Saccostrea cucullata]|uniref:uncharacterized protein LOC134258863 n=1 Tax=Saccostrea cuccullata TaxID=36930 RepID=UPI002ED3A7A0